MSGKNDGLGCLNSALCTSCWPPMCGRFPSVLPSTGLFPGRRYSPATKDTPADIYEKFCQTLTDAFQDGKNDFDNTAKRLSHIPGLIKKFAFWFLNLLDYFGMIPLSLFQVSPIHGSLCITSMGSLGIQPIYHHLYDFGNVPVFCAFGAKRKENCLAEDGSVVQKKYMDYTFTTDERICDGFYFAESLKLMKRYLLKPELLDTPPLQVYQDID